MQLSIQRRNEVALDLANEAKLETVINELEFRLSRKHWKARLAPLPFLRDAHNATPDYERELRGCMGINQKEMARLLQVGADVISGYERGKCEITEETATALERIGSQYATSGMRPAIPEQESYGGRKSSRNRMVAPPKVSGSAPPETSVGLAADRRLFYGILIGWATAYASVALVKIFGG